MTPKKKTKGRRSSTKAPGPLPVSEYPLFSFSLLRRHGDVFMLRSPRFHYYLTLDQVDHEDRSISYDPPELWMMLFYEVLCHYDYEALGIGLDNIRARMVLYACLNDLRKSMQWLIANFGEEWMEGHQNVLVFKMMMWLAYARMLVRRTNPEGTLVDLGPFTTPPRLKATPMLGHEILTREMTQIIRPDVAMASSRAEIATGLKAGLSIDQRCTDNQADMIKRNKFELTDPKPLLPVSRSQVLSLYKDNVDIYNERPRYDFSPKYIVRVAGEKMYSSTLINEIGSSQAPVESIKLHEMKCPHRHTRKVLYCRVITQVARGFGVAFGVEDENGHAITLNIDHIYPYPSIFADKDTFESIYSRGVIIAVFEPYVRYGPTTGVPEICVSIPTDVIEIPRKQRFIPFLCPSSFTSESAPPCSGDSYRATAAAAFLAGDRRVSVHFYSLAVAADSEWTSIKTIQTRIIRAEVLQESNLPGRTLAECMAMEELIETHRIPLAPKDILNIKRLKLTSAYQLRLLDLTTRCLKEYETLNGAPEVIELHKTNLELRLAERGGNYEWWRLHVQRTGMNIDVSDFLGPVSIDAVRGQGRCVTLTRDVAPGEMISVEKAILRATSARYKPSSCSVSEADDPTSIQHLDLASLAVEAILADPSKVAMFDSLTPAPYRHSPLIKESKRLEMIVAGVGNIDMDEIRRKIAENLIPYPAVDGVKSGVMVFPFMSLITHSCLPTAMIHTIGDTQVLAARCHMKKGDLITVDRLSEPEPYFLRQARLKNLNGLVCECAMCQADAREDDRARITFMKRWPKLRDALKLASTRFDNDGAFSDAATVEPDLIEGYDDFVKALKATYRDDRPDEALKDDLLTVFASSLGFLMSPGVLKEPEVWPFEFLRLGGAVFSTPEEQAATGRGMTKIPIRGDSTSICTAIVQIAMVQKFMDTQDDVAVRARNIAMWVRTALWAFIILEGTERSEDSFWDKFESALNMLGDRSMLNPMT